MVTAAKTVIAHQDDGRLLPGRSHQFSQLPVQVLVDAIQDLAPQRASLGVDAGHERLCVRHEQVGRRVRGLVIHRLKHSGFVAGQMHGDGVIGLGGRKDCPEFPEQGCIPGAQRAPPCCIRGITADGFCRHLVRGNDEVGNGPEQFRGPCLALRAGCLALPHLEELIGDTVSDHVARNRLGWPGGPPRHDVHRQSLAVQQRPQGRHFAQVAGDRKTLPTLRVDRQKIDDAMPGWQRPGGHRGPHHRRQNRGHGAQTAVAAPFHQGTHMRHAPLVQKRLHDVPVGPIPTHQQHPPGSA